MVKKKLSKKRTKQRPQSAFDIWWANTFMQRAGMNEKRVAEYAFYTGVSIASKPTDSAPGTTGESKGER